MKEKLISHIPLLLEMDEQEGRYTCLLRLREDSGEEPADSIYEM